MKNSGTVYFPRINNFWKKTDNIRLNSYLNLFSYLKSDISEGFLEVIMGAEIPYVDSNKFKTMKIHPEKTLSYVMGLYYEEIIHDIDYKFKESLIKNLKMRISVPFVILRQDLIKGESELPVLCCGYNNNNENIIIINPKSGEYEEVSIEDLENKNGQFKLLMLNVPGMIKMKSLSNEKIIKQSLIIFIRRFYNFYHMYNVHCSGFEALKSGLEKESEEDTCKYYKEHIINQNHWFRLVEFLNITLDKDEQELLDKINIFYNKLSN